MGQGVSGVRGAGLWGQEAHLSRRRRRWLRLSAGRSRHSRARAANLPRGALAVGQLRAGGRGEQDWGSACSERATGGGGEASGCGDAVTCSTGGRGLRPVGCRREPEPRARKGGEYVRMQANGQRRRARIGAPFKEQLVGSKAPAGGRRTERAEEPSLLIGTP